MIELKISDIKVADRKRTNFGKLDDLAESIKENGLINPILVELRDGKHHLVAGERRIRASILAGIETINATTREGLTPVAKKELELHENLHRKDFDWTEQTELMAELHQLKQAEHGVAMQGSHTGAKIGWGMQDTATALDKSKSSIQKDLELVDYLKENPELKTVFKELPKTTAMRKMEQFKKAADSKEKLESGEITVDNSLRLGDFSYLMTELEDESIDLIITDPPYGTEAVEEGKKHNLMERKDNLDEIQVREMLLKLLQLSFKKLKPGRHMYLFFSLEFYSMICSYADMIGWSYNRFPVIWNKDKAMTPGTGLNYTRSWEPFMFLYKPHADNTQTRALATHQKDIVTFQPQPNADRIHAFQKPLPLLEFLIDQSSIEGELILDPFAGSAATLIAAKRKNRSGLGFEVNEEHFNRAQALLSLGGV